MSESPLPEFVTLSEAARLLKIGRAEIRKARDSGELSVYRLGERWQRYDVRELRAWLESKRHTEGTCQS